MPILARLDKMIAEAKSPLERAELMAERATYMVRAGDFENSDQILQAIRGDKLLSSSPRVMVWVMLAEGVAGFFKDLDPRSRDRLLRAYGIARAANQADLERICASWLVHADFNRCDFDSLANYVRRYAERSPQKRDAAAGRIAIVIADLCLYVGEFVRSVRWYETARQIAVEIGDEATLGAIMHDRAALNSTRARLNEVIGNREEEPLRFLRMEIDSSESFHRATHQKALPHVTDVVKARVLQCEGRYQQAAALYLPIVNDDVSASLVADRALLRADLALCLMKSGHDEDARRILDSLSLMSAGDLARDDQVIFWSCIHQLAVGFSMQKLAESSSDNLERAKMSYLQEIASLRETLYEIEKILP